MVITTIIFSVLCLALGIYLGQRMIVGRILNLINKDLLDNYKKYADSNANLDKRLGYVQACREFHGELEVIVDRYLEQWYGDEDDILNQ